MNKQTGFFQSSSSKPPSSLQQRSTSKSKDINSSPMKNRSTNQTLNTSNPSTSRKSPGQVQLSLKGDEYSSPIKGNNPGSTTSQQGSYTNFDLSAQQQKDGINTVNSVNIGRATLTNNKSPQKSNTNLKGGILKSSADQKSELVLSQQETSKRNTSNLNIQKIESEGQNELNVSQKYQQEIDGNSDKAIDLSSNLAKQETSFNEDKVKMSKPQKSQSRLEDSPTNSRHQSFNKTANPNLVPSQLQKRESAQFSLAKTVLKRQNTNNIGIGMNDKLNQSTDNKLLTTSVSATKYKTPTISNNNILNAEVAAKEKDGNVKVYARFRPNNSVELEIINQGLGSNIIEYNGDKTVSTQHDNQMYTFDRVFRQDELQNEAKNKNKINYIKENIYKTVAVEVVNDVLQGYNGTIFTYGVTGSGKTHTMFGKISEETLEGIIPRMCKQLFEHVNNEELDIEYIINVSMLEIYKENLFDSLNIGEKQELKIKEHPQKGIIVHGLSQRMIGDEDSLYDIIDYGYNQRQTRATRLNEYSSRSHTVFMVDIAQKLPNGSEKSGKLNLIDLAGSEKVSKSGAVGESLEEAIKINVSLTCLGKVIHALTTGQEYIPYRDSKLTRILQESLGGNYKTSLIVCCSMHSNFQDDTVSTLKFATRAKTIKNHFKQNIKSSPESMKQAIELLKQEVFQAKNLLQIFHSNIADVKEGLDGGSNDPEKMNSIKKALNKLLEYQTDYNPKNYEMGALTEAAGRMAAIGAMGGANGFMGGQGNASVDILIARVKNRDEEITSLKATIVDVEEKNKSLENELLEIKKSNIKMESEINDLKVEKNSINVKFNKEVSKNDFLVFQIEILQKQIQNLVDQVCKSEKRCAEYLQQKKKAIDDKIDNIMKDDLSFAEIKLSDYFNSSINFNYEINIDRNSCLNQNVNLNSLNGYKKSVNTSQDYSSDSDSDSNSSFISSHVSTPMMKTKAPSNFSGKKPDLNQLPLGKPVLGIPNTSSFYKNQAQPLSTNRDEGSKGSFLNNISFNNISNNANVEMLKRIIEIPQKIDEASQKDPVSKDFMIINLKKSLINAHIINQNLLRTISALEWKQIIEYGKSQLKSNVIKIQGKHILNLEQVIDENSGNQRHLREKMEEIELEIHMQQKEIKTTTSMSRCMPRKSRVMLPVPVQPRFQNTIQLVSKMLAQSPKRSDSISSDVSAKRDSKYLNQTISSQNKAIFQKEGEEDLQEMIDMIDKNVLPLTYENAIIELKKKNSILKRLIMDQSQKEIFINTVSVDNQKMQSLNQENERLRDKIITLTSECEMEQAKTQSYKGALQLERKNINNLKKLNQEMEISLRNNLKEENESWQNIINTIKEQNEKEMVKRQQDYNVLNEKLNDVIEKSMYKIEEMKTRGHSITVQEIEQVIAELQKSKNSVSVTYENKSAKRRSLLFIPNTASLNPHSPHTHALLQTFQQLNQQENPS